MPTIPAMPTALTPRHRGTTIMVVLVSIIVVFGFIRSISGTAGDAVARNGDILEQLDVSAGTPDGVNSRTVDGTGLFVAQSAFNIDLSVDMSANDAVLRNARGLLSSSLISKLERFNRAGAFVEGTKFDSLRNDGVAGFRPTKITETDGRVEKNSAEKVYALTVTPYFEDSQTGSPLTVSVRLSLSRTESGADWKVTSFRQVR